MRDDTTLHPHDLFCKQAFGHTEVMLDFLAAHLPPALFTQIEPDTLRLTNKSFVNPVGKRGEADLVFQAQIAKQAGYIYCLVEHQSTVDPYMPLRFLEYNVQLMRQHLSQEGHSALPLILNICLYNGKVKYRGATHLVDLFDDPSTARHYIFQGFHLVDLSATSNEDLKQLKQAALAAMVLKQGIYRNFVDWLIQHQAWIEQFEQKQEIPYIEAVCWYMLSVDDNPRLLEILKTSHTKLKDLAMSIAQRLRQAGRQEGVEFGLEKGRQEGELQKALSIAKNMLLAGFDRAHIANITGVTPKDLEALR